MQVNNYNTCKNVFSIIIGKFNPQLVSKEKDEYFLENLDDHYVCLAPGNDPKLTSLKKVRFHIM